MRKIWIVQSQKLDKPLIFTDRTLAHHKYQTLKAKYPEKLHQLLFEEDIHIPQGEKEQ